MTTPRQTGFRIGCFHGKLTAEKQDSEAQLRNELYLIGMLEIELSRKESIQIRLVAYEMPLHAGKTRGRCIDLFGYDQDFKPWIIELKGQDSNESIPKIAGQINGYAEHFVDIRESVRKEIQQKFHWKDFRFQGQAGKIILASREYWARQAKDKDWPEGIYCCSFSHIREVIKGDKVVLLENNKGKGIVGLTVHNKLRRMK
ncbi:MAG TPA: hypothetical protein PLN27_15650 [Acidobacteriota bacterium]|nr:hypothetical protein [Acidobacteriota bacterium]HQK86955.1 hypothetical protein [Acidobacteriota bacterium]